MNKEQLLALGLTEEQVNKVLESYKGYVPSTRFNEVNEAKKNAESQLKEVNEKLELLTKKNDTSTQDLNKQITDLIAQNKATQIEYEKKLKETRITNAIELALTQHGAKNVKAVKALIDVDKVKVSDSGDKVEGLEDQIKALTTGADTSFLFETKTPTKTAPKGTKAGDPLNSGAGTENKALSLADAIAAQLGSNQ